MTQWGLPVQGLATQVELGRLLIIPFVWVWPRFAEEGINPYTGWVDLIIYLFAIYILSPSKMNLKQRDLTKDPAIWLVKLGVKCSAMCLTILFLWRRRRKKRESYTLPRFPTCKHPAILLLLRKFIVSDQILNFSLPVSLSGKCQLE